MKKRTASLLLLLALCCVSGMAQANFNQRPKLVVGIVVDQMRWDYLSRYYSLFGNDGFRRLLDEGYSCNNCLINYVPTVTAIGHTSIYTGTTPAFHGICGNNFYIDGKKTYCTQDDSVLCVGSDLSRGKESPRNLLANTIGDQLRLHTDFQSKVIGVSYKDRAAILPAGRSANAAYWLDTKHLCFISSTWYMNQLPQWVQDFNVQLSKNKEAKKAGEMIGYYPICGTVTTDMAIAALKNESLGKGKETDMLCVSYSQTDVIGHKWGTRGEHTDAAYLSLDKDLTRLFQALDEEIGKGNYLVFLTADHGGAHNWRLMQEHKLNGGPFTSEELRGQLEEHMKKAFGNTKPLIDAMFDCRFFLNKEEIARQGLDLQQVKDTLVNFVRRSPHVLFVADYEKLPSTSIPPVIRDRASLGYHYRRSGDVIYFPEAGYYEYGSWSSPTGTTHGEWNPYDAHIPLLFYGWHIEPGHTSREVHITDIAPTICQMLHIQQPNACIGEAIGEVAR